MKKQVGPAVKAPARNMINSIGNWSTTHLAGPVLSGNHEASVTSW
jgi:hypothetical protein